MNLLIVDDEQQILQGILQGVQWELLNFTEVFTAKGYEQAVQVFEAHRVEILLSDIELDRRNGLDLIEWVNDHSPETACLILSCHEEFNFARRAVKLKCLDYILKPVPYEQLTEILLRTKERVQREHSATLLENYGKVYMRQMKENLTPENTEDSLEEAVDYIRKHISEEMTVEFLALKAHVSPRHLNRLFQKRFGQSVGDYISKQRMMLAGELLKDERLSVTMVSDRVGYGNYSYFTKLFKKFYGMTPREYRMKTAGEQEGGQDGANKKA